MSKPETVTITLERFEELVMAETMNRQYKKELHILRGKSNEQIITGFSEDITLNKIKRK